MVDIIVWNKISQNRMQPDLSISIKFNPGMPTLESSITPKADYSRQTDYSHSLPKQYRNLFTKLGGNTVLHFPNTCEIIF